jgi:hypothetical protein
MGEGDVSPKKTPLEERTASDGESASLIDASNPLVVLRQAIIAVPSLRYALGVVGVAAAGAIIGTLAGGHSRTTLVVVCSVFVGMILLFLFSKLVASDSLSTQLAGHVVLWAVTVVFVFFLAITATAAAAGWPCKWAVVLGFEVACDTPSTILGPCLISDYLKGKCK